MFLICLRQEDITSDGVVFLKEEGRLCAAGECMSHPAGWAVHRWPWCSAIWTALCLLTGWIVCFLWLSSFSVVVICLVFVNKGVTMVKYSFVLNICVKLLHFGKLSICYVCFSCTLGCVCCCYLSYLCFTAKGLQGGFTWTSHLFIASHIKRQNIFIHFTAMLFFACFWTEGNILSSCV